MTRDLDLIRAILIKVESFDRALFNPSIEGYDTYTVNEHILLCIQAGFIDGGVEQDQEGRAAQALVKRLTWNGHEFLTLTRNNTIWEKAKKSFTDKAVSYTLEMVFMYLRAEASNLLP